MATILVLRLSALGDVAMTVPVVSDLARQYPHDRIVMVTRKAWQPLFALMPPGVEVFGVDLTLYRGLRGLGRLYGELRAFEPTLVADLHDVLRTKYLRLRFRLAGCRVAHIDKGRREKRRLTRNHLRLDRPLKHSVSRYAEVLARLGRPLRPQFRSLFAAPPALSPAMQNLTGSKGSLRWVGVAPFARHEGKIYPSGQMAEVLRLLTENRGDVRLFLFGGGPRESALCARWASQYRGVTSLVGHTTLADELCLMAHLDVMVSMDSANMHLAALCGTPVLSVWGATHPNAGFAAWNQPADRQIQLELPCRPCSIYGNRPCPRGDNACLTQLRPQDVAARIMQFLEQKKNSPQ